MIVTLEDIATTLLRSEPTPDSVEGKAWTMWAKDAERQIINRFGSTQNLNLEDVKYVIREAVAMKIKRPDQAVKVDVAVDDGSVSKTYEKSPGYVVILDEWWAMLQPVVHAQGAFTINPFGTRPLR